MIRSCSGPVSRRGDGSPRSAAARRSSPKAYAGKVRTSGSRSTRWPSCAIRRLDALAQRGGAPAAEGQHQDAFRVDPLGDPGGDRLDQRAGLAGAGTAEHQHRPVGVRDDLGLHRIDPPAGATARRLDRRTQAQRRARWRRCRTHGRRRARRRPRPPAPAHRTVAPTGTPASPDPITPIRHRPTPNPTSSTPIDHEVGGTTRRRPCRQLHDPGAGIRVGGTRSP